MIFRLFLIFLFLIYLFSYLHVSAYAGLDQSTLVGVPYYHGANHKGSSTPTPATPLDGISPLARTSPQQTKLMTRHKSTTSGDSGFGDLLNCEPSGGQMKKEGSDGSGTVMNSTAGTRVGSEVSPDSDRRRRTESGNSPEMETSMNGTVAMEAVDSAWQPRVGVRRHSSAVTPSHTDPVKPSRLNTSSSCHVGPFPRVEFSLDDSDTVLDNCAPNSDHEPLQRSLSSGSDDPIQEEGSSSSSSSTRGLEPFVETAKPQRSRMWLDFGGFFKGRNKERPLPRSPSSPATLSSSVLRKTPEDQKIARLVCSSCDELCYIC